LRIGELVIVTWAQGHLALPQRSRKTIAGKEATMRLRGKRVAVLLDEGFEDLEFWVPVMRLREEQAEVTIVGTQAGRTVKGKHALPATSDVAASDVSAGDFDAVVVPGGWAPDKLRRYPAVTGLVRGAYTQNKIVGLICHAGLVGISAGIVKGHKATGSLGIKDDLVNAGATWVDEAAFRDGCLVWGRVVEDIPDFCRELVKAIEGQT
jgi:protease I